LYHNQKRRRRSRRVVVVVVVVVVQIIFYVLGDLTIGIDIYYLSFLSTRKMEFNKNKMDF